MRAADCSALSAQGEADAIGWASHDFVHDERGNRLLVQLTDHPLETLKNCAQAGLPRPRASLAERVQYLGGPRGLYRGALPSILCGGLRNGCATVAMNGFANPLITRLGLRET